jgi:integrase/recombinase XerD
MSRKDLYASKAPIGDAHDPESLYSHMRRFLAALAQKHYSPETVETRGRDLRFFLTWCEDRGLQRPGEITRPLLERYQGYLFHYRKANGEPLAASTQHQRLVPVGLWFRWMAKQGVIPVNPASELELPKLGLRLPKAILTAREAEAVIAVPDTRTTLGLRDRAIMETFYSTGMRRAELIHLHLQEVDIERGCVLVREGKGGKDRVIPIGARALAWIEAYCERSRPKLVRGLDDGTLFLTNRGGAFSRVRLTGMMLDYVNEAGIGKKGACHLFRHTMATLLLEGGMDIRYIQAMLGHADLNTTQIYTLVSVGKLKAMHTATHPGTFAQPGQHPPDGGRECAWDRVE